MSEYQEGYDAAVKGIAYNEHKSDDWKEGYMDALTILYGACGVDK